MLGDEIHQGTKYIRIIIDVLPLNSAKALEAHPVSTCLSGSGSRAPEANRLNWINTSSRFLPPGDDHLLTKLLPAFSATSHQQASDRCVSQNKGHMDPIHPFPEVVLLATVRIHGLPQQNVSISPVRYQLGGCSCPSEYRYISFGLW